MHAADLSLWRAFDGFECKLLDHKSQPGTHLHELFDSALAGDESDVKIRVLARTDGERGSAAATGRLAREALLGFAYVTTFCVIVIAGGTIGTEWSRLLSER